MVREIIVDWTTPSGGGKATVMYFLEATAVTDQRDALETMLNGINSSMAVGTTWSIRTVGRELDTATGSLLGEWTDGRAKSGAGTSTGEPLPDASQALIRWTTGNVVAGRFLKGRTFIPGISALFSVDGNLGGLALTNMTNAVNTFVAAAVQAAVWHRPVSGAGGVAWAIEGGSVWTEFAVLRRRRG